MSISAGPSAKSLCVGAADRFSKMPGLALANDGSRGISHSVAMLGEQCTYRLLETPCFTSSVAMPIAASAPLDALEVALAGSGQPYPVRAALEQPRAELRFQPGHLVADRRRREVHLGRGQRETAPSRDRLEGLQIDDRRQRRHREHPVVR